MSLTPVAMNRRPSVSFDHREHCVRHKKLKLETVVYMQSDEVAALGIFPMCAD